MLAEAAGPDQHAAKKMGPGHWHDKGEYVVWNDVCMADIRLASLVYLLVYVSTYCVPIALLRQNKPFPLLYLGLPSPCTASLQALSVNAISVTYPRRKEMMTRNL